jgi:CRP-like cAMP-binding protein
MRKTNALFQNRLLTAMPAADLEILLPLLTKTELALDRVLEVEGQPISDIYFFESGIAASRASARRLMVAMIGNEGMSGLGFILGYGYSTHDVAVIAGGTALRISANALRDILEKRPKLRSLLLRFAQVLISQTTETAVSGVRASIEERLARWILMAQDRVGEEISDITHETLSTMLGVRRAGVTTGLQKLEGEGLIISSRAHVSVRDRPGLERRAANFYGLPEAAYVRLITWQ